MAQDTHNPARRMQQAEQLLRAGRPDEAIRLLDRFLKTAPSDAQAWNLRGVICGRIGRFDEAMASFDRALALEPASCSVLSNKGNLLRLAGRLHEALHLLDQAVAADPEQTASWALRADIATALGDHHKAAQSYGAMLLADPTDARLWLKRAAELLALGRTARAHGALNLALALDPALDQARYDRLYCASQLCDWTWIDQDLPHVEALLARDALHDPDSFRMFGLSDDPRLLRKAAEASARQYPARPLPTFARPDQPRIRIGYFSSDLHEHATAWLVAELFELHDRQRFEIHGYSFGPEDMSPMRRRLEAGFDHFHDVRALPAPQIAALARSHGIDIAVDLKGYTAEARPAIFAERAAPVQVNYLGWPGTMGASFIDYIIADDTVIPQDLEPHYSEAVVRLPHCYQVNDRKRPIAPRAFTRSELGLPASGFVFCCFNNPYKITPAMFASWMRILDAVEDSILWLLAGKDEAARNLRDQAARSGIAPDRLVFAPLMRNEDHLARCRLAGLFLDTAPCNAHTTMSDALWAGLPAVTRIGTTFAGRVGASLLRAAGLPELVTQTQAQYEALAIALARDPTRLAALRDKLAAARTTAPLFDTPRFVRDLEHAYQRIHQRRMQNLPPGDLQIDT